MLGQAQLKFLTKQSKKVKDNKEKQKELKKWLDWACSSPLVAKIEIKNKVNKKWYEVPKNKEI